MSGSQEGKVTEKGPHSAFFYGTLMEPKVFFTVCYSGADPPKRIQEQHEFKPAVLHDYCRKRVQYADYPGMTKKRGHTVRGTYATGLTDDNIEKLDWFEGSQYIRSKVKVRLLTKVGNDKGEGNEEGEEVEAETYVFVDKSDLEDKEWDLEEFRRDKMQVWTRAGYVFEECDPDDPAGVEEAEEEIKESAV